MLALRELIFKTAAATNGVGELTEQLKWGEPAYITQQSRSGSTVRIDWKQSSPDCYAMYFNCQTNLIDTFRTLFPDEFSFEGNRALVIPLEGRAKLGPLAYCIAASLTYHSAKRTTARKPTKANRMTPNNLLDGTREQ